MLIWLSYYKAEVNTLGKFGLVGHSGVALECLSNDVSAGKKGT